MTKSNSMTLESVYTHPGLLTFGGVLLFVTIAPAALTAYIVWYLAFAYFILVVLDLALIKYHLWNFKPTVPQAGHYALITGGSTGIGREMAFQLAAKGYSIIIAARTQSALDKTQSEIRALHASVDVLTLATDLSSSVGIQQVIDFVQTKELVIDILINNAFVTYNDLLINLSAQTIDQALTLNVLASTKLSHFFAIEMAKRGVGRILNVASSAAVAVLPTHALYSSTKAMMLNLSMSMNYEMRGTGVTVTCFCPGPVSTNFCDSGNNVVTKVPGMLIDPKTAATVALEGMLDAEAYLHDSNLSYLLGILARVILPMKLRAYVGGMMMNEADKIFSLLKR